MRNRFIASCLLGFTLVAACGADEAASTRPANSADGAGCDDSDPVKVGASLGLTGPTAAIGTDAEMGAELAVEDVNAEGGVLGRCLELIVKDDGADPTKASQVGRELVDLEQVDYIIGPFLGAAAGPQLEVTAPSSTPQVIMSAAPVIDPAVTPYVFSTEIAAAQVAPPLMELIASRGFERLGVVGVNDAGGQAGLEALQAAADEVGVEIETQLEPAGTVDRAPAMRALQSAGVDVVYVNAPQAADQIAVITARNQLNWDVTIVGTAAIAFSAVTDNFADDEMENVLASNSYAALARGEASTEPTGENAQAFQVRLREARGESVLGTSLQTAAGSYDSVRLIAHSANEAGSLEGDAIREYLEANGYEGVKATYVFSADDHQGVEADQLLLTVASSLEDGTLLAAPSS